MLKIKTIATTCAIGMAIATSSAIAVDKTQNINLISPWTNTGSSHALGQEQSRQLAEKGWNLTNGKGYQSAGNCLNAFNIIDNSEDPSIYIWENAYHSKTSGQPCYRDPIKESEFVALWYSWTEYMCRTDENLPRIDDATGTITVGVTPVNFFGEERKKVVEAMTDANVQLVRYENAPSVLAGAKIGEVDYVYGMYAPGSERTEGILTCSYNSSTASINGTDSISASFDDIDFSFIGIAYLVSHDLDQETINAFRDDWNETVESEEISSVFSSRSWSKPSAFDNMTTEEIHSLITNN